MNRMIVCPFCNRRLALPELAEGIKVCCPSCREVFSPEESIEAARRAEPVSPGSIRQGERAFEPRELVRKKWRWDEDEEEWRPRLPWSLPGRGLGILLVVLLGIGVLVDLGSITFQTIQLVVPVPSPRVVPGFEKDDETVEEAPVNPFSCIVPVVYFPTVVVFCMWMWRSYRNLLLMEVRGLSYSPRWAVGAFFVPILNLFRPCQIAQEMWRASAPDLPADHRHRSWRHAPGSAIVGLWWAFWLIANVLYRASYLLSFSDDVQVARTSTIVGMIGDGVFCFATLCAIAMILNLRTRQKKKLERMLAEE
jgi:hypothetical protein